MSNFEKLIEEAVGVTTELEKLSSMKKLTPKAFYQAALKNAGRSEKQIADLEKQIQGDEFENSLRFIRRVEREIKSNNWPSPPIKSLNCFGPVESHIGELAQISATTLDLVYIATKRATQKSPKSFGDIEDMVVHQIKISELESRRDDLYAEVEKTYGVNDLTFGESDAQGRVTATFKISDNKVPLGPNAAIRLVAWFRQEKEKVVA